MQYKRKAKDVVKIIGFEYICELYKKSYNSIAEELGISRQSINGWIKGLRPIPKKHLPKLAEIFELPEEYFQKELLEDEKENVKRNKINYDFGSIVHMMMEVEEIKNTIQDKTVEEQIDYVESMYMGLISITEYILNKKTLNVKCEEIAKALKEEEDKEIDEILEMVKEIIYEDYMNINEFKKYLKDYKYFKNTERGDVN